ncbi:hypothetical protein [Aurantimonas sp. 22II-16-19i]|uniref:hypothetical protein n=1 Tax=Aurantimonas sp. 22II-16-19i TaxID=1317114 RepID=UPI0009F7A66B|nr:hypothetical protein [Aurantimonas sp. 22II-16-19i]ORE93979.1 hypothetical protein ATO4_14534 [Aurantimonas sp. 22II-16-19i]
MQNKHVFTERLEATLIVGLLLGIALITQRYNLMLYKVGLSVLVASTLLQIAVGNMRKDATPLGGLFFIAKVLLVIVAVFSAGILLVPTFAQLGR